MRPPPSLPTLDQIATDPACLVGLSPDNLTQLLLTLSAAQSTITARLISAAAAKNQNGATSPVGVNESLNAEEIAAALHHSKRWLYRSAHKLPFLKRVGRSLICSRRDLEAWRERQRIR